MIGVGLRQCTLGLRPYMGHELAVVRSQSKWSSWDEEGVGEGELQRRWSRSGPAGSFHKHREASEVGRESLLHTLMGLFGFLNG